jgi:alkyl hydroperoxide reductase subunit AhpC
MRGVGKRAVFVIDAEGFVRHMEVLENSGIIPDFVEVQKSLRNLQSVPGKQ